MFFTTVCPSCGTTLQLDDEYENEEARCGRCGTVFVATPINRSASPVRRSPPPPPREPDYDDDADESPTHRNTDRSGYGTTSLVLGFVNLFLWCCAPLGMITSGLAIVLGAMALQSANRSAAIWGIWLSTVGFILSTAGTIFLAAAVVNEGKANKPPPNGNRPPFFNAMR